MFCQPSLLRLRVCFMSAVLLRLCARMRVCVLWPMTRELSHEEHKQSLDSIYAGQAQALGARQQDLDKERKELEEWYKRGLAMLKRAYPETDSGEALPSEKGGRDSVTPPQESILRANGSRGDRPWGRGSMSKEARIILDEIQDDEVFTQPLVRERFVEKYPGGDSVSLQTAISHLLRRLSEEGELERFGKNSPTEPYQYRKTPQYRGRQEREEAKHMTP